MKNIEKEFIKNEKLFIDIRKSAIGKYSVNDIIDIIEKFIDFLELSEPIIKKWAIHYLEENRGKLWLYYGINLGTYLTDYWKIKETDFEELGKKWEFLFNRKTPEYKGFIIDLKEAQNNIIWQRERQNTSNPNYMPFHPDGCPSGCSCFMLDDMEQWYDEEQNEIKASKNIFFNDNLQKAFYSIAINDLDELKSQWYNWLPEVNKKRPFNYDIQSSTGKTPIQILIEWIDKDFIYSPIVSMFSYMDTFDNIWKNIGLVKEFIECKRHKLKKIREIIY